MNTTPSSDPSIRRPCLHVVCRLLACLLATAAAVIAAEETDTRPATGVQDNSFFIEEAYNQDPGVVQHILNIGRTIDRMRGADDKQWDFLFTQEWPMWSQLHQISYSVPYSFNSSGGRSDDGIGDIFINYRYQVLTETASRPAFAPRFSVILPTGNEDKGFGDGTVGYQLGLPFSKIVSDRWTLHANAGLTVLPDVQGLDLVNYNLGASAIYAVTPRFNLMLECIANLDESPDGLGHRDRSTSVILSPGARYAFNFKNDAQMVVGLAAPIGLTTAAPDFGIFLYFSFEHAFAR